MDKQTKIDKSNYSINDNKINSDNKCASSEEVDKEVESNSTDNAYNVNDNILIENTDNTQYINDYNTEDYAVIDPYEICEFQTEIISTEEVDSMNIDTGDTVNEQVHDMSVSLTKGKSGAIFLPFITLALPFLVIAICSLLVLSPLTAIVWSLLSISVYNLNETPENKGGFKNFFKPIADKTLISATAVYRIMTLFSSLLLFIPSLFVRLNYGMFPYILRDMRENGDNPDMIDLFAASKELMKGHRLEYLSLMLYSLLSIILTVLTLGIISIWSIPYLAALKSNFYVTIKSKSIAAANNNTTTSI